MMAKKTGAKHEQPTRLTPEIVSGVKLERIQLVHCDADLTPADKHGPLRIEIGIACNAKCQDGSDPRIVVALEFRLTAMDQECAQESKPLIVITGKYQLVYKGGFPSPVEPDCLKEFVESISIPDAWPYWCGFIQSTAMRMGLPPMPIPLSAQGQLRKEPSPNPAKQVNCRRVASKKSAGKKKP